MLSFSFVFLEPGQKILVVHRRLFEKDRPRFFIGTVDAFNENNGLLKVSGFSFGLARAGGIAKKMDPRTKIHSLTSGTLIIYQLPESTTVSKTEMKLDESGSLWLTDGMSLKMDMSEAYAETT